MARTTRRTVLGAGVIGAASLSATSASASASQIAKAAPSTYLLVHGACGGGWIWRRVADRLRSDGHRVFTPTLTGEGERQHLLSPSNNLTLHVTDVVNVIHWEQLTDIVLVGHSYAGMVISGVAEHVPNGCIRSIVFLDAAVPADGQSLYDYVGAPEAKDAIVSPAPEIPGRTTLSDADAALLNRLLTPQSRACFSEKPRLTGARERIPVKTFIAATKWPPPRPDQAHVDQLKRDPTWRYEELACGHNTMLEAPGLTADRLEQAAA